MSLQDEEMEFALAELMIAEGRHKMKQKNPELKPMGECHNCCEPLGHKSKLFCDRDCAIDWEKYAK